MGAAMGNRADDLRKKMAKRKRELRLGDASKRDPKPFSALPYTDDEEKYSGAAYHSYDPGSGGGRGQHPLFKPDVFMFKLLIGACLVLVSAIVFKNDSPPFEKVQHVVTGTFEEEFQFARLSKWYGEQFGDPLALIKPAADKQPASDQYTAPASGKVLETFEDNGQGVMVETSSTLVEAMNEGVVIEIGKKEESGLTVVVQHDDSTESWYGNLEEVQVSLYDFVENGKEIGKIKAAEDQKGTYYFAIKKGEQFIDPIQVISFE